MIFDKVENWQVYGNGEIWKTAFEFLLTLNEDTEDGEYPLLGKEMFARVMSYETKKPEDAVLEGHKKYIDIQSSIRGAEGIEWYSADVLEVKTPYIEKKDALYYVRPGNSPARVDVFPGTFALFFPDDAHMPKLEVGGRSELIKKAVVKIDLSVFSFS